MVSKLLTRLFTMLDIYERFVASLQFKNYHLIILFVILKGELSVNRRRRVERGLFRLRVKKNYSQELQSSQKKLILCLHEVSDFITFRKGENVELIENKGNNFGPKWL